MTESKLGNSGDLPAIVRGILWIFNRATWRNHTVKALLVSIVYMVAVAGVVIEVAVGIDALFFGTKQAPATVETTVPDSVTWHRAVESCKIAEPFLQQIKRELSCGDIDPLSHGENEARGLRATLEELRGEAERRYADYLVFYSSPLGGTQRNMKIVINRDVEAVAGFRIFELMGTQVVAAAPVLDVSNTLEFSTQGVAGIERVVVFVFPLDIEASEIVKHNPFEKFATITFGEETP